MKQKPHPFFMEDPLFQRLVDEYIADSSHRLRANKNRKEYALPILAFRRWLNENKIRSLDEAAVKQWLLARAACRTVITVSGQAIQVNGFCRYLLDRGLMPDNPFDSLRCKHHEIGFRGMARLLKETGSLAALDAVADLPFSGPLGRHFRRYLDYRAALGKNPATHFNLLASFERFLRRRRIRGLERIDAEMIRQWQAEASRAGEHLLRYRLVILDGFFRFMVGQEEIGSSPVPEIPPHRRRSKPPHVYTREQVSRILDRAAKLPDHRLMPYRGPTYRLVFLLLYALGLRISEALNLQIRDIDFDEDSLIISETKFSKSRVLPFGSGIAAALRTHLDRNPLLTKTKPNDFLFPTDSHRTPCLRSNSCSITLRMILRELDIQAAPETRAPNLHSFRHSFAVHRVERWYGEGAEVNAKLPLLSAFMGHVDVAATQVYLTMTPDRLRMAGEKFEAAYGRETAK